MRAPFEIRVMKQLVKYGWIVIFFCIAASIFCLYLFIKNPNILARILFFIAVIMLLVFSKSMRTHCRLAKRVLEVYNKLTLIEGRVLIHEIKSADGKTSYWGEVSHGKKYRWTVSFTAPQKKISALVNKEISVKVRIEPNSHIPLVLETADMLLWPQFIPKKTETTSLKKQKS